MYIMCVLCGFYHIHTFLDTLLEYIIDLICEGLLITSEPRHHGRTLASVSPAATYRFDF